MRPALDRGVSKSTASKGAQTSQPSLRAPEEARSFGLAMGACFSQLTPCDARFSMRTTAQVTLGRKCGTPVATLRSQRPASPARLPPYRPIATNALFCSPQLLHSPPLSFSLYLDCFKPLPDALFLRVELHGRTKEAQKLNRARHVVLRTRVLRMKVGSTCTR